MARHSTASRCVEVPGSVGIPLPSHSVRYHGEARDTVHVWRDNGTDSPEPGVPRLCPRGSTGRVPRGYLRRGIQAKSIRDYNHRCHGFVEYIFVARGCRGTQRPVRRQFLQAIQTLAERECKDGDLAGVRAGARAWRPHGIIRYRGWVPALLTGAENAQLVPIPLRGQVLPLCRPAIWLGSQPDVVHTAYGAIGMKTAYRAWISSSSKPRRLSSLSGKGGKSGDQTRLWQAAREINKLLETLCLTRHLIKGEWSG
jgi:hypothetical protein